MKPWEFEKAILDFGYEGEAQISNSAGEHLTRYFGGHHAICLNHPSCNPDRMGALTDKIHAVEGLNP